MGLNTIHKRSDIVMKLMLNVMSSMGSESTLIRIKSLERLNHTANTSLEKIFLVLCLIAGIMLINLLIDKTTVLSNKILNRLIGYSGIITVIKSHKLTDPLILLANHIYLFNIFCHIIFSFLTLYVFYTMAFIR